MQITFDTNMFLHNLDIISKYPLGKLLENGECEHTVVVLLPVIAELDNIKINSSNQLLKYKGRKATKFLKESIDLGLIKPLDYIDCGYDIKPLNRYEVVDDLIISICKEHSIKLITMDYNVYLKCKHLNIDCELYEIESKIENPSMIYKGVQDIHVSKEVVDEVYEKGFTILSSNEFNENEYVTLIDYSNPKHTVSTRFRKGKLWRIKFSDKSYWGLKPLSLEQRYALDLLDDDSIRIVTMTGEAGTAKSVLSLAVGLEKKVNHFGKGNLYITRPPVALSKRLALGFKKGDTLEKAIDTLGCYATNLEKLATLNKGENRKIDGNKLLLDMLEQCEIRYLNLESILGMSFSDDDYIIVDEAELLTKDEMKAIVTRGGKIVILGDVEQGGDSKIDYDDSGLLHLIDVGKKSELIGHITLQKVYRSEICEEINKIW